ncbi:MAG: carbon-nitrogen hydrolase family protein [Candidatus Aminicenantaceae bacterium]
MAEVRVTSLCYTYGESAEQNQRKIAKLLKEYPNTDFLLLPEDTPDIDGRYAEKIPGPFSLWLQELACRFSINIIGPLTEKADSALFSTCLIIGREGHIAGKYRKIQLSFSDTKIRHLTSGKTAKA